MTLLTNGRRYLLLQRGADRRFAPLRWTGLCGHVEADEFSALRASALREVQEEAGIGEQEIRHFLLRRVLLVNRPRQPLGVLLYFTGHWDGQEAPSCPEGTLT